MEWTRDFRENVLEEEMGWLGLEEELGYAF